MGVGEVMEGKAEAGIQEGPFKNAFGVQSIVQEEDISVVQDAQKSSCKGWDLRTRTCSTRNGNVEVCS